MDLNPLIGTEKDVTVVDAGSGSKNDKDTISAC
jgi:hypothetical protein